MVRLKAGDPCIFGRAAEEIEAVRAAGIRLEIVPGITAGLAVGDYAEIPITHAERASAVALVTGHQRAEKDEPPLDYAALAGFPGTLVFYMGVTSAAAWSRRLIAGGLSHETPVAIVQRCSWPQQRTLRTTLGTVADTIAREKLRPPAVIVVGEVAALAPEQPWFNERPLCGVRVLVTRPIEQADDLRARLAEQGAEVLVQPAVRISDPPDWAPVDAALARLSQYDWLVFSSANGVRYLFKRLLASGDDLRRLGAVKLAAIGPGTAAELAKYHLRADLVPAEYRAEGLAEALAGRAGAEVPLGTHRSRPADPARDAGRCRRRGRADCGLCDRRGGRGRSGHRRGFGCGPNRLGHGDQLGHRPVPGPPVRRFPPAESPGQHQPGNVCARSGNWAMSRRRKPPSIRWPGWSRRWWRRGKRGRGKGEGRETCPDR